MMMIKMLYHLYNNKGHSDDCFNIQKMDGYKVDSFLELYEFYEFIVIIFYNT